MAAGAVSAGAAGPLSTVLHVNEKGGSFGGTEEYIELVSRAWAKRGVRSQLVCGRVHGTRPHGLDAVHVVDGLARRDDDGSGAAGLADVVDDVRPDIVYVHNVFDPRVIATVARAPRAPFIIWYVHDHYVTCLTELRLRKDETCGQRLGEECLTGIGSGECVLRHKDRTFSACDLAERRRLATALRDVDVVAVVSEYMARTLRNVSPGLVVHRLSRPIRTPAPRRPGIDGAPCSIAFAGRITAEKGLDVVLDALVQMRTRRPVRLRIAGAIEDPLYWTGCLETIARAARANLDLHVEYLGHLDYDAADALLADSDIVVVPSRWPEPLGAVALEAMAAECTVIASSIGGLTELIDHGENGLLAPPGDVMRWAEILDAALDDATRRRRLAANGRMFAAHRSVEAHLDELAALYHQGRLVSRTRPRR
jgi:glycosyltransferase involved in cell wall biosynthesis